MTSGTRPLTDLLLALAGPIVWAGHFIGVYLTEALLCPAQGSATHAIVRAIGGVLTVLALAALFALVMRNRRDDRAGRSTELFFALPLTLLSVLAVLWTSLPLLVLPACAPGGA
jgi:hypothetical protein